MKRYIAQPKVIAIISGLLIACWVAFYPGFMSPDSLVQYEMSKTMEFNDWHPPIMSWVWSILGFFFPGPSGLLALHLGLVWISVYIWWFNYQDKQRSWLLLCLPLFPWILNFAGVLWKDVGLAFTLFAVSGLLIQKLSRGKLILGIVLVFYAINLRHNAVFAVFPILFCLIHKWLNRDSILKSTFYTCAALLLCLASGYILNYKILDTQKTKPSNYMMVDDLVFFSIKENTSLLPGFTINEINECAAFDPGDNNKLVAKIVCLKKQPSYETADPLNVDLKSIWFSKVIDRPLDYLSFRLAAFSYLLRSPSSGAAYIWQAGIDDNSLGLKHIPNGLTVLAEQLVSFTGKIIPALFKPYWWLLSALMLLAFSLLFAKTTTVSVARVLSISSVFYILGYIPLTPLNDFRYVYWSVLATNLSLILLIIDWPGFRSGISKTKVGLVVAMSLCIGLILFSHQTITALNIDRMLNDSLQNVRVKNLVVPTTNDLVRTDDGFQATGKNPYFLFDFKTLNLNASDISLIKFEFYCSGPLSSPRALIKGGSNLKPNLLSSSIKLVEGVNVIPLKTIRGLQEAEELQWMKFEFEEKKSCQIINIDEIEFLKKRTN